MRIDALSLKRQLEQDLMAVARAMLNGVETWEMYQRLVGQATEISRTIENLASLEAAAQGEDDV